MVSLDSVHTELEKMKNNFNNQWMITSHRWDDSVSRPFSSEYVDGYTSKIDQFIIQSREFEAFIAQEQKKLKILIDSVR